MASSSAPLVFVILLASCGGRAIGTLGNDGGADAPSTLEDGGDAASTADGCDDRSRPLCAPSSGSPCPASPPSENGACPLEGLWCEYDVMQVNPYCNDLWRCTASGWQNVSTSGICPPPTPNCPDSYADVPVNEPCPNMGQVCAYPSWTCGCSEPPSGSGNPTWVCLETPARCPDPIPMVGSVCAFPAQTCDYGACVGGVELQCDTFYNPTYGNAENYWGIAMTSCH